jgi:CTP synthase
VELQDSYKSILEAFIHAGAMNEVKVEVVSIHSEELENESIEHLFSSLDGVLVAPGFGSRGIEGKIDAVRIARESKIPFLGICLGMQMAVIEFTRNVLELNAANSVEVDENTEHPVIHLMEEQKEVSEKGGTMRLGSWKCSILEGSKLAEAYGNLHIDERHRHRFELNNEYINALEEGGLKVVGVNPDTGLAEAVELADHPWFVGVQYHPEYKSTVENPHPLFVSFVKAALEYKKTRN